MSREARVFDWFQRAISILSAHSRGIITTEQAHKRMGQATRDLFQPEGD